VLKNLEQQRDQMLATVTHDLRNPLTSIFGMSQLLQRYADQLDESTRERYVRSLKTIEHAAGRMTAQIGDLLEFSRAQAGNAQNTALESTDVIRLVRGILEEYQHASDRHTIELQTTEVAILAMVDPRQLERAIANLLVNAVKYSPRGGAIVVTVARSAGPDGRWLQIEVADKGLDIPSADLPHTFEPYYRASNVVTMIPGTGLGLAGVRHMIERHGGTVALDSTEGVGTTVTMRLPLHEETAPQIATAR
jgi:signal transduction histidine kinase